ncbi:carboxymuconolactone decarboxylase family protein [Streptomyces sp. KMM 9044]|uniref:carboxymuconolactone decarboxylase family protein n=1 Tax=Streptomyces sp. KMM 9044 TaxID=2744474 RepID=UPI0021508A76|nr:carboxymuconolactone decarboxylase family protein [Streptomyces sp. KMM 9044]WAX76379.1 carboxymuconolactone decarboxylase family protein [Streptomyces sp. KMM 9044]
MNNPSLVVPDALQPLLELTRVIGKAGVPQQTLDLVRLRVSQINGRVYTIPADLGKAAEADERLPLVAGWREAACFGPAERAALALAEGATDLSGQEDPVSDEVWEEATRHYTEEELASLVIHIGLVNLWNRINVSTRQVPAAWR